MHLVRHLVKEHLLENNTMIGHICELVCEDNYIEDVIKFAINHFSNSKIKNFTIWMADKEQLFLNDLGFKKITLKNRKFIYRGKNKLNKSDWNLSMSFSDVY